MIVEILFILHVANGILIITHNVIWYNYMNPNKNNFIKYSYICMKKYIFSFTFTKLIC